MTKDKEIYRAFFVFKGSCGSVVVPSKFDYDSVEEVNELGETTRRMIEMNPEGKFTFKFPHIIEVPRKDFVALLAIKE